MSLIELNQVSKIYDETIVPINAVDNVDLKIEKGEFTAIVGPSGSGKTTMLNLIGGLDQPTSGNIIVDGTDISTYKPDALLILDYIILDLYFRHIILIPVFTAKENVEFIMLLQNISKAKEKRKQLNFCKLLD